MDILGIKKANIAGWSTGGGVAMKFAFYYPEMVNSIILVSSITHLGIPFYKQDE